ncbi:MAG: 3-hydroxy-3-methylglutaryl-CoA reductase, partial [Candidatus Micrarchaeia archaeon]
MDYLEKLLKKELKPHELDSYLPPEEAVATRRKYVEQVAGTKLVHIANSTIDFTDASKRNIENAIGAVQLPVGFVELSVHGDYLNNDHALLFLATTEGKLVAGVNRGASAINKSGGARASIIGKGMSRSVILDTGSVANSAKAIAYIRSKEGSELLRNAFKESNRRIDLLDAELYTTGRLLFVRYVADTKAAMGMNMLTIAATYATEKLVENLAKQGINAKFLSESGNMCVDKKPSVINMIRGRGVSVVAEA